MLNLKYTRLWALLLIAALIFTVPALAEEAAQTRAAEEAAQAGDAVGLADAAGVQAKSYYDEDEETYVLDGKKGSHTAAVDDTFTIDLDGAEGSKWRSSKEDVAEVDEDGGVTCLKKGTTKISVTATVGTRKSTRTLTLKVYDPNEPIGVTLCYTDEATGETYAFEPKEKWHVIPGTTMTLEALVMPDEADQDVTWKSDSKKVATIDEDGEVYALKPGSTKITATAVNGVKQYITLVVDKNSRKYDYSKAVLSALLEDFKDDETTGAIIKSVEVQSVSKVVVRLIFFNGTDEKVGTLYNASVTINAGYYDWDGSAIDYDSEPDFDSFLSGEFKKIRVSCKPGKYKEIKLTFTDDAVENACWWVKARNIAYEVEIGD